MDIYALWEKALKRTELHRLHLQDLSAVETTAVPYVFLGESTVNAGDTVIRRGQVLIEKPSLVLPPLSPQFEGFEFGRELQINDEFVSTFLLVRGVQFPSLKYRHELSSLDVVESTLQQAIDRFTDELKRLEDIRTGLVIGPEDAWQFSILILVGALVVRSAPGDLRRIIEAWRRRQQP